MSREPSGPGEITGVGEDVPPHGLGGVGDLLRIHSPDGPYLGAGVEGSRVGIAGRFVRGQQHRAGGAQDRGYRQCRGFTGPRGHDRQEGVLPGGAEFVLAQFQSAEQYAAVVRIDVLGLAALEAGTEVDGLGGYLLGQQRSQLSCGGQPRGAAAEVQPRLRAEDGGSQEYEGGEYVACLLYQRWV